jgi:stage II sporulation protein D
MNGGGYGHGIGMSQNGAQAMALNGKKCEEILKFFFKDIEIENGDVK